MSDLERPRPTYTGTVLGIVTFLAGIGVLVFTFKLAFDLFGLEPASLFDLKPGAALDLNRAGATMMGVIIKVLLLLVMALVGGIVASRGIHLYADSRARSRKAD